MKKREKYLNSKLLFQLISDKSHELIFSGGKCNQVLNHLISMEKYSGRLCNPKLVGRVEFQWKEKEEELILQVLLKLHMKWLQI